MDMKDVEITTWVSGSEGGCRVIHIPTGLAAECIEFQGIFRNERKALEMLKNKIKEFEGEKRDAVH